MRSTASLRARPPILLWSRRAHLLPLLVHSGWHRFSTSANGTGVPRHPLVLCHGLLGFGRLLRKNSLLPSTSYFREIGSVLREAGCMVLLPVVPMTASVPERAAHLLSFIGELYSTGVLDSEQKLNLVCHSMGGIDARYMISNLGGWRHVASCTTLSTPHRGTSFADWGCENIGRRLGIDWVLCSLGVDTAAFHALTMKCMRTHFNPSTLDHESVRYFSFAAAKPSSLISPLLKPSFSYIEGNEGRNDGLVSVSSSVWGEFQGTLHADHYEIINWRLPGSGEPKFDAKTFYVKDLLGLLCREGL